MEQIQMTKFCIELEGMMLPDAIAAVVEAWYDAQNCTPPDKSRTDDLIPMADLAGKWRVTANTVSRRLAFLGIKPIRQGNCRLLTPKQLDSAEALHRHIFAGMPMDQFSTDVRLIDWAESVGLSRSTVYELIKLLDIEPVARRVPNSRRPVSHLTVEHVRRMNPWATSIASGMTLHQIRDSITNQSMTI
jgi:hypothetical protein